MIFEKTLSTIKKYNLIEKGDKIVLGLSGGPDSVCLLHLLNRMKDVLDIEVYAAHLNHQIRGMEAKGCFICFWFMWAFRNYFFC